MTDPNDLKIMNYKKILDLCKQTKTEFNNQSFAQLVRELKAKFMSIKNERVVFTPEERSQILKDFKGICSNCNKRLKEFHIDHIIPLAVGGTNDKDNLQPLCKACHMDKTALEQENGYVKVSETESSFNSITKDIFNSKLCHSHAFVETVNKEIPSELNASKTYSIDINKCRKNKMFYSAYDYPVFTVMDSVKNYDGNRETGLYYIQTKSYFPLRGNGWYLLPTVEFCLKRKLIQESDIKYFIKSSLSIPKNYFNEFITYCYSVLGDYGKLSINSMVGCFKPKPREQWNTVHFTTNPNEAFNYFLNYKDHSSSFIDIRQINDIDYYQVYDKYITVREETDAILYQQVLEEEAIELYKLSRVIQKKNGYILDLKTDCVVCAFKDDVLPFKINNKNIEGFYYDVESTVHRYKLEDVSHRLTFETNKICRREKYKFIEKEWNIITDSESNDFKPLVDSIMNNNSSYHIDGRAGCGKSHLVKLLQAEMDKRKINYISLAPTNKAANVISGCTIHRFIKRNSKKTLKDKNYEYIFIDEISMVSEIFYKYFIVLKRALSVKFIISGDFEQLLPVKDRVGVCDYKNSMAIGELSDFNRLQLSHCRRADDELFNMLNPVNIDQLKKSDFKNNFEKRHICFTNDKRKKINDAMMDLHINETKKIYAQKKRKFPDIAELKRVPALENTQNVKLCENMPIIARKNIKELDIANNEQFIIKKVYCDDEIIIIVDEVSNEEHEIKFKDFQYWFNIGFCITTHKSQGQSYDFPYTIHEFERFDSRMRYVSLSRATKKEFINIV